MVDVRYSPSPVARALPPLMLAVPVIWRTFWYAPSLTRRNCSAPKCPRCLRDANHLPFRQATEESKSEKQERRRAETAIKRQKMLEEERKERDKVRGRMDLIREIKGKGREGGKGGDLTLPVVAHTGCPAELHRELVDEGRLGAAIRLLMLPLERRPSG